MKVGLIGGSGMLGRAIARALWDAGLDLTISNRSGTAPFEHVPVLTNNQTLAEMSDVVVYCVPPAAAKDAHIDAPGTLVISVMAGVTRSDLTDMTGSTRVVRAMCSPAAANRRAFSPWCVSQDVTESDRAIVSRLFSACGETDEVPDEAQIELFTALTGPVPGFVAQMAAMTADYAVSKGVSPAVADRAVRQLFLAAGEMMATGPTPAAHVQEMIDYAGTTAAGLLAIEQSSFREALAHGFDAAIAKTRSMTS